MKYQKKDELIAKKKTLDVIDNKMVSKVAGGRIRKMISKTGIKLWKVYNNETGKPIPGVFEKYADAIKCDHSINKK